MNITTRLLLLSGLALFAATGVAVTCSDMGDDVTRCRLEVTQDVTLERGSRNFDYLEYLIIAEHPSYPLKRSLIQFEDLSATDGCKVWHTRECDRQSLSVANSPPHGSSRMFPR